MLLHLLLLQVGGHSINSCLLRHVSPQPCRPFGTTSQSHSIPMHCLLYLKQNSNKKSSWEKYLTKNLIAISFEQITVKLRHCEKATKFEKKSPSWFDIYSVTLKPSWRFFKILVNFVITFFNQIYSRKRAGNFRIKSCFLKFCTKPKSLKSGQIKEIKALYSTN